MTLGDNSMVKRQRRPNNFWAPFSSWWRAQFELNQKRPKKAAIQQWFLDNAHSIWSPGEMPQFEELLKQSKGLRTLPQVREYFRAYRHAHKGQDAPPCKSATRGGVKKPRRDQGSHTFTASQRCAAPESRPVTTARPIAASTDPADSEHAPPTPLQHSPVGPTPARVSYVQMTSAAAAAAAAAAAKLRSAKGNGPSSSPVSTAPAAAAASRAARTSDGAGCSAIAAAREAIAHAPGVPTAVVSPTSATSAAAARPRVYGGSIATNSLGGSEATQNTRHICMCGGCGGGQWPSCDQSYTTAPSVAYTDGSYGPHRKHPPVAYSHPLYLQPHTPPPRRVRQSLYLSPAAGWHGAAAPPGTAPAYYSYSYHPAYSPYPAPYGYSCGYGYTSGYGVPAPSYVARQPSLGGAWQSNMPYSGTGYGSMSEWPTSEPIAVGDEGPQPIDADEAFNREGVWGPQAPSLPVAEAVPSSQQHPVSPPINPDPYTTVPDAYESYGGATPDASLDAEAVQPQPTDLWRTAFSLEPEQQDLTAPPSEHLMMLGSAEVDAAVDIYLTWMTKDGPSASPLGR